MEDTPDKMDGTPAFLQSERHTQRSVSKKAVDTDGHRANSQLRRNSGVLTQWIAIVDPAVSGSKEDTHPSDPELLHLDLHAVD